MPRRLGVLGPYEVAVIEYEEPPLERGQVRIRTKWASGKHGTTTAMFDGGAFRRQTFDQGMRLFVENDQMPPRSAEPGTTGTSGVGTVIELGPESTRWHLGDLVFGRMDVRETNVCLEERLWPLGDIDAELAMLIEPAYVAFHCVRESNVRFGDQVAVIGLGALGLLAVRIAVASGVERIYAVDPLPCRRRWATEHGASVAIDPADGDAALKIHRSNGGPGVDVAIELSGAYSGLSTAIRSVRVGGTVCSAGFYQREADDLWLGREWHHNRLTMIVPHGCGWGHPPRDFPRWDEQRATDAIVSMMRQGKLTAPGLIRPIVSLEEMPEVFRIIKEEPDQVIKFAVRF